ncbi:hypothetical protein [Streptomyces sp. MMBL 11-3]|uniref:hypothetical protein n=1 Tax=Streptomyces sp. MMBL 11-3 TaxID=3382639 RepID=UPI0039B4665E
MPDNIAGPSRDGRQRDGREDPTRTPGTDRAGSGARDGVLGGRDTAPQERIRDGRDTAPQERVRDDRDGRDTVVDGEPVPVSPGQGDRGGALGDRETAAQERAREGRDTVVDGQPVPAGPGPAGHDRPSAPGGATGKATGGRTGASREGLLGAEARVTAGTPSGTSGRLMPHDEGDKWSLRLQHAVTGFVDGPKGSVEEADKVLQEVAERFTDAVTQRRRALRTSWQGGEKADTEQLRLALKDYRELAERLLRI